MASPEPADLPLDTAFLMRTDHARAALEGVMTAQRGETLRLQPITTLEDPQHRGFEVVIAHQSRDGTEMLKGQDVAFQERFLGLGAERDMKRPP